MKKEKHLVNSYGRDIIFVIADIMSRLYNLRRFCMSVSYKKLWMKIAEKEMKRTDLKDVIGISSNTLANIP